MITYNDYILILNYDNNIDIIKNNIVISKYQFKKEVYDMICYNNILYFRVPYKILYIDIVTFIENKSIIFNKYSMKNEYKLSSFYINDNKLYLHKQTESRYLVIENNIINEYKLKENDHRLINYITDTMYYVFSVRFGKIVMMIYDTLTNKLLKINTIDTTLIEEIKSVLIYDKLIYLVCNVHIVCLEGYIEKLKI